MGISSKFLVALSLLSLSFLSQSTFAGETEKAVETAPVTEEAVAPAPADCFYPDGQCSSPAAEETAAVEEAEATVEEASE